MRENLIWHSNASAADKGIGAVAYVRAIGPVGLRAVAFYQVAAVCSLN